MKPIAVSFCLKMKYLYFFKKAQLQVRVGKFKEWNAKNRIEKSSFFNEIFTEYKEKKNPIGLHGKEGKSNPHCAEVLEQYKHLLKLCFMLFYYPFLISIYLQ